MGENLYTTELELIVYSPVASLPDMVDRFLLLGRGEVFKREVTREDEKSHDKLELPAAGPHWIRSDHG